MSDKPVFPTPEQIEQSYIDTIKYHPKTDALRAAIRTLLLTEPGPKWVLDLTGFGGANGYSERVTVELREANWHVSIYTGSRGEDLLSIEPDNV